MGIWCPECKIQLRKLTNEVYECERCLGLYQVRVKLIGKLEKPIEKKDMF